MFHKGVQEIGKRPAEFGFLLHSINVALEKLFLPQLLLQLFTMIIMMIMMMMIMMLMKVKMWLMLTIMMF